MSPLCLKPSGTFQSLLTWNPKPWPLLPKMLNNLAPFNYSGLISHLSLPSPNSILDTPTPISGPLHLFSAYKALSIACHLTSLRFLFKYSLIINNHSSATPIVTPLLSSIPLAYFIFEWTYWHLTYYIYFYSCSPLFSLLLSQHLEHLVQYKYTINIYQRKTESLTFSHVTLLQILW